MLDCCQSWRIGGGNRTAGFSLRVKLRRLSLLRRKALASVLLRLSPAGTPQSFFSPRLSDRPAAVLGAGAREEPANQISGGAPPCWRGPPNCAGTREARRGGWRPASHSHPIIDKGTGFHDSCPVRVCAALPAALPAFLIMGAGSSDASAAKTLGVGLVADATVLNDRSAGHSIYLGLRRAVKELGVSGRVLTPSPKEGFGPEYRLPRAAGIQRGRRGRIEPDAIVRAAHAFPRTTFVVPDQTIPHRPPNVRSLIFREEQDPGFLVGYLAALMERMRPGRDVVGSVGGFRSPSVDRYIAGFRAGARAADPAVVLLNGYSNDFVDPRRCRGVASGRSRGARGRSLPLRNCGFGALEAARVGHVWGIGVDTDQSYLGAHILTSAVKREDVAVFDTIRALRDGLLRGGSSVFTLNGNGGLQLGRISRGVPGEGGRGRRANPAADCRGPDPDPTTLS